jgi:O-antigen/teichoic acid export membrane protein
MLKIFFGAKILLLAFRIIVLILGQISNILIIRISSVEIYSQYILINSLIMTICLINQNGLSQVILREIPNFDRKNSKITDFIEFTLVLSAATSAFIIFLMLNFRTEILSVLVKNSLMKNTESLWLFLCFFIWFSCLGFLNIITESFRALGKVGFSLTFGGIEGIGGYGKGLIINIFFILISAVYFVLNKKISIFELISISTILNLFILCISIIFLIKELKVNDFSFAMKKHVFINEFNKIKIYIKKYSGIMFYLLCSEILLLINSQSDLWLLNIFSNQLNVGFYSVSLRTIGIIIIPVSTVCSIYIAKISKSVSIEKDFNDFKKINRQISLSSIPSILLLIVLMFFSGEVLTLIYGNSYEDASLILRILTFRGLVVVAFPALMASLLMVATKTEIFVVTIFGMLSSVFLEYILLKYFDANGLAIGSVLGYSIEYLCAYSLLKNKYSLNTLLSFT